MSYPQDISPLPWKIEARLGHSSGMQYRWVIVDANGKRVAIVSLNGAPEGDVDLSKRNAKHLCESVNENWDVIHD